MRMTLESVHGKVGSVFWDCVVKYSWRRSEFAVSVSVHNALIAFKASFNYDCACDALIEKINSL